MEKVALALALGRYTESPFPEAFLREARACATVTLIEQEQDLEASTLLHLEPGQPFFLHLLAAMARQAGDPDWRVLTTGQSCALKGFPVGAGEKLDRVPAVYDRKVRWRKLDESARDFNRESYPSTALAVEALERQFLEEQKMGMMIEVTDEEARAMYPGDDLRIASLAALEKDDDTFRVVHDGTHGVMVNPETRVRDQIRNPGSPDVRGIFLHESSRRRRRILLKADVSKAHRRCKTKKQDWGKQACRLRPGKVWLNKVGTFGIGSAGGHWDRVSGVCARTTLCIMLDAEVWQLKYVDDLLWILSGTRMYEDLLLVLLLWCLVGTPFSWHKTKGGFQVDWIGLQVDIGAFTVGITNSRVEWLIGWLVETLDLSAIDMKLFASGLGRLGFALTVIEYLRPFLAPLYSWSAAVPSRARLPLPIAVRLAMMHLLTRLRGGMVRMTCEAPRSNLGELFRTDASAHDDYAILGGWECRNGTMPKDARWFSIRLTAADLPAFFIKGGSAKRVVAGWELLATMVAIRCFVPDGHSLGRCTVSGATDNQGNSYIVSRCMTTSFPLNVILMQLANDLESKGAWLALDWLRRDRNVEADSLTNEIFVDFNMDKRLPIRFCIEEFRILEKMLAAAAGLYAEVEARRQRPP